MNSNIQAVYHPRNPQESPLWKTLNNHYESFHEGYEDKFEKKHGFFRPVISKVISEYLSCGDLRNGFARVRCDDCSHEYLLAFSCKGRWFCPTCHAKKVIRFGELLRANILYPIHHRQYVFSIPILLRVYFKYDRRLLGKLCRCAYDSLLDFLRITTGLEDGAPGVAMTIHTFGDYVDKFHPHIHAICTDGLFTKAGVFYVMPKVSLKTPKEIFQASVFAMLKKEGKIGDELINKLMNWRHSGFSVHNKVRIARDDEQGKEALAQYIIRNTFSVERLTYVEETGTVIYKSKMTHGQSKKNFEVYTAEEFIAGITQHIPEKSAQMVRYYGWYSNKSRGMRRKQGINRPGDESVETKADVEIIDVSEYNPPRIPSKTWRECIKKIWEIDPLCCPRCHGQMRIISFITEPTVIYKILDHLDLWKDKPSRSPPKLSFKDNPEVTYEPFCDDWPIYEEPFIFQ